MKCVILVLVIVSMWYSAMGTPLQRKELHEHIRDFIDLIPLEKIRTILDAANQEPHFHSVVEYIFSYEFKALVLEVENIPEVDNAINELDNIGVPIRNLLVLIHVRLELPPPKNTVRSIREGNGFMQQIINVLPLEEIKALYEDKMYANPEFKEMIDYLKGSVFRESIKAVEANTRIQEIVVHLNTKGIDVKALINLIKNTFGLIF